MRSLRLLLPIILVLLLLCAGCNAAQGTHDTDSVVAVTEVPTPASTPMPTPTPKPTPITVGGAVMENNTLHAVVEADDFALIEQMPTLRTLDVSGSVCYDAILRFRNSHPSVTVIYTVPIGSTQVSSLDREATADRMPDPSMLTYLPALRELTVEEPLTAGTLTGAMRLRPDVTFNYSVSIAGLTVPRDAAELDLSEVSPALSAEVAEAFTLLPELADVELNRADGTSDWTLEDAMPLMDASPSARVNLTVTVFDRTFCLTDEIVSFNKIPLDGRMDELLAVLPYLRNVGRLDMEDCGLSDEQMAALREEFPSPKIAWMIHLGYYSFRSDSKMLRLNKYNGHHQTLLTDDNVQQLTYCNEVKYLDLGHNLIQNPYFVAYMPDLEVCIIAIYQPTDLSAFANCPNLEYAELFNGHVTDVSPLANCTHLKHLNLCMNQITDITPLYGLTELERLWISRNPGIPKEQIDRFKELVPGCVVNTTTVDPTDPPWRFDPRRRSGMSERYELLRKQFRYGQDLIYSLVEPDKQ